MRLVAGSQAASIPHILRQLETLHTAFNQFSEYQLIVLARVELGLLRGAPTPSDHWPGVPPDNLVH
jgi:hypothetical protein